MSRRGWTTLYDDELNYMVRGRFREPRWGEPTAHERMARYCHMASDRDERRHVIGGAYSGGEHKFHSRTFNPTASYARSEQRGNGHADGTARAARAERAYEQGRVLSTRQYAAVEDLLRKMSLR